jgi:hypothetical protein
MEPRRNHTRTPQSRSSQSVKPTREEQRRFAADKFKFLRQVACNRELPRIASQFAILLLSRFNLEYDGVGWAGQDTLAEDLGCHRVTVNRLFALFVKHGHLTYKRGGWGQSNRYQMALREEAPDVAPTLHQQQTTHATDVAPTLHSDVAPTLHESILTNQGAPPVPPWRETGLPPPPLGALALRPPHRRKKGNGRVGDAADHAAAGVPHLQALATLRGMWVRGHPRDVTERECKAVEQAWAAAMGNGATPEAILTGAQKWIAAADAPRFLTILSDWLATCSWDKPPPPKNRGGSRHKANGSRRHRSNGITAKQAVIDEALRRMQ